MERIILIAQQLSREGKVPNTALIKARLPKNTPLPVIIQGLKMWKENPHKELDIAPATAAAANVQEESLDRLLDLKISAALAPLLAEMKSLQAKVTELQQLASQEKN